MVGADEFRLPPELASGAMQGHFSTGLWNFYVKIRGGNFTVNWLFEVTQCMSSMFVHDREGSYSLPGVDPEAEY